MKFEAFTTGMRSSIEVFADEASFTRKIDTGNSLRSYLPDRVQVAAVKRRLDQLSQNSAPPLPPVDAAFVRRLIRARRIKDSLFDTRLFADAAWDILLDLAAAHLEGKTVSISSLCTAAAVPTTTGLRCMKEMSASGMLERHPDPDDRRRSYIRPSPPTLKAMLICLGRMRAALAEPAALGDPENER